MSATPLLDILDEKKSEAIPDPVAAPAMPGDLQPLRMAHPNPEEIQQDRVLSALSDYRSSLIEWLRERMVRLYHQRQASQGADAYVTADDARLILDTEPGIPGPDRLNRNFLGGLFRNGPGWVSTGKQLKSRTPGSHANRLLCWRYAPDRGET